MVKKLSLNVGGIELTKADIKKRFNEYNIMYFGGKLGDCKFIGCHLTKTTMENMLPNHHRKAS
jgi:hypothetical protein